MPKQFKTYNRFEGGLNTKTNQRSIQDNELAQANNVIVDEFGVVKSSGKASINTTNYAAQTIDASEPGYGLFQARFDYNAAGNNTPTVATFLADTDASADTRIDVYFSGGSWSSDAIDIGDGDNDTGGKIIYHIADGGVRVCDSEFGSTDVNIKNYSFIERSGGWSGNNPGGTAYPSGFQTTDVLLSKPTAGIASKDIYFNGVHTGGTSIKLIADATTVFEAADIGSQLDGTSFTDATCDTTSGDANVTMNNTILIRVGMKVTGTGIPNETYVSSISSATNIVLSQNATATNTNVTLTFSGGQYFAINNSTKSSASTAFDVILSRTDDRTVATSAGGAGWSDNTHTWSLYPPSGKGWNLDIDVTATEGDWIAGTYEFASTFIYDNAQESLPYEMAGTIAIAANDKLTCTIFATELFGADFNGNSRFPGRVTGGRVYSRISGSDDEWVLLGDINISRGTRPSLSGSYVEWSTEYTNAPFVYSRFVSTSINADTYESLNGFSQDEKYISLGQNGESYKTSVVSNRRVFIANVKRYDSNNALRVRSDSIMYSEINRFDTFPNFNFIDIGVNDGDEFIKLEAFADRLLAYKENTLYVINIGGGSDTQWFLESEHKNMGVAFHAAVVKTEFGVAWVNENGLFFYDGSQIRNLQNKILDSDWKSFVNDDTMIGYQPTQNHLVIMRDAAASGSTSGDCYIYSFITNSFTFVKELIADSIKTNMITDAYNNLTFQSGLSNLYSYNGESDSTDEFDIKLKDDDFGLPNIVKKLYSVTIEYATDATSNSSVKCAYISTSGEPQTQTIGNLDSTTSSDIFKVQNIAVFPVISASSFQLQIDLGTASKSKINNIGIEYRPIRKRIT